MTNRTKTALSIFAIAVASIFTSEYSSVADGNAAGTPGPYCGAPFGGSQTCAAPGGCHTGATVVPISGLITTNIPTAGYAPGATYTITGTITSPGHAKFGFEMSPQNSAGTRLGTFTNPGTGTQTIGGSQWVTHTQSGTIGIIGSHTWTFDWTAPAAGAGDVTFYGMFMIANGDALADSGDSLRSSTLLIHENDNASAIIAVSPIGTICNGTSVTFTVTPTNGGTAPTYQWQIDGSNVGTNNTTYNTTALTDGQNVTCVMTSNMPGIISSPATSNQITMSVNSSAAPTITSTTPGSRCNIGKDTLGATASIGIINWYAADTGGSSLGTGTSFITPSISATTIYYVDATSGLCTSIPRTFVIASIPVTPTITRPAPGIYLVSSATTGNSWYYNGQIMVPNETNQKLTLTQTSSSGNYMVVVTANGCSIASAPYNIINTNTGIAETSNDSFFSIYPNPNDGNFNIESPSEGVLWTNPKGSNVQINIYNVLGEKVYEASPNPKASQIINVSLPAGLGQGIYTISLTSTTNQTIKKIIVY